jgi:photosystem II stability/assembly factor-like uncharacterized protein
MRRMYVATGDAVVVLAEQDGRWAARATLAGSGAQCLAVAPDGTVFAGSRLGGVWRSADGGATWSSAGLADREIFSVAVGPAGDVFAGCEPSALFRSDDGGAEWVELGALRGVPSASSWSYPPRPWTSHVRWIAPDPHDPDRLLAGIEAGAVLLTEDGGWTWQDHRPGADRDPHALAWHPAVPGRAYQAGGGGAAWSRDGGRSWRRADAGRDRHYTWGLALDPGDPDRWWVSAASGPWRAHGGHDTRSRIYRWDEGAWRAVTADLDAFPYALLLTGGALYAGLGDGRMLRSPDGGETWADLHVDGDAPSRVTALAAG